MPRVHTTKEYEKARDGLLTRGSKIGKDAYDKARVAESEALQGSIRTVPRTDRGEDRIPDAEKYDLPGHYRLVVQRVNGVDPGRVFLFVGSHGDTERWLDNHRGLRWQPKPEAKQTPDSLSRLEQEKQRLQQELKKQESEQQELTREIGSLEQENGELGEKLRAREKDLERLAAQVKELEGKQGQIEAERQQVLRQRELLAEQQRQLAGEKAHLQDSLKTQAAERLAAQVKELEGKQGQIEAERQQVLRQRELLAEQQRQLAGEKAHLQDELQRRTAELTQLSTRVAHLERENQSLRRQLDSTAAQRGPTTPPTHLRNHRWVLGTSIVGVIVLVLLLGIVLWANGCGGSGHSNREPPGRPVISPAEAPRWEGKEATVRVVVKSTYDRFDWAFMINSEEDFKHPDNFTIVIVKKSAGAKYKEQGVSSLRRHFQKGTVLLVTGTVEKYKNKPSGKERYQIKVKDPDQIQRE